MDVNAIKISLYDYLITQSNTFGIALTGGLHYVENNVKHKDVSYPYCVYNIFAGSYDKDTINKYADIYVQFSIYSENKSSTEASDIGDKLDARLEDSEGNWTISGMTLMDVIRLSTPREAKTNIGNWEHIREFKIKVQL